MMTSGLYTRLCHAFLVHNENCDTGTVKLIFTWLIGVHCRIMVVLLFTA